MNTHTLIYKCKHLLNTKYKVKLSKKNPTKNEVVKKILLYVLTDPGFKKFDKDVLLTTFYQLETGKEVKITVSNKEDKVGVLSERCRVTSEPATQVITSRKTQVFSQYINPHNIDLSTLPF